MLIRIVERFPRNFLLLPQKCSCSTDIFGDKNTKNGSKDKVQPASLNINKLEDVSSKFLTEDAEFNSLLFHDTKYTKARNPNSKTNPYGFAAVNNQLSESEKIRFRMQLEARAKATAGADRVVFIALACNMADTICKFGAAYLTGSKSLFAEAIHSTMDTVNQFILYLGMHFSARNPDPNFPYGYGNIRYITSMISGCGILSFGCGLSIYHGVSGLLHPTQLEPLGFAFAALALSFCFQSFSLFNAYREIKSKASRSSVSIINYLRRSGDPGLNVVLLEDTAAVLGVCIAFCAVSASYIYETSIFDCCGSIAIGILLGCAAIFIIRTNAVHLVGRSLPKRTTDAIIGKLLNDKVIKSVHDVKATSLGVETSRFKAEIDFNGREITSNYLKQNCDLPAMLYTAKSLKDEKEMEEFMLIHGEKIIDRIGDEVDRLEREITTNHPDIQHVDLESE